MIHHRHSCHMTTCGKTWKPRRHAKYKRQRRRKVSKDLDEVTCSACVGVLANKVQRVLVDVDEVDPSIWPKLMQLVNPTRI